MTDRDLPEWDGERECSYEAMSAPGRKGQMVEDLAELRREVSKLKKVLNESLSSCAEMSYNGRLVPINSTGMRELMEWVKK